MRRAFAVGMMALATLVAATPAFADDLDDYLDKAAAADYAGTQVVVTVWDGEHTAEEVYVERLDEMLMVGSEGREVVAGGGKTFTGFEGVVLAEWAGSEVSDRYTTSEPQPTMQLGRDALAVTVFEDDRPRVHIVFDADTWAPMSTEVYDASGNRFRFASFTDFDTAPRRAYEKMGSTEDTYEVVTRIDETSLPAMVAGYGRLDVYRDQDGVIQAFYGDGLFSFSVFQLRGDHWERRFREASAFHVDGDAYAVLANPADVWVRWMNHGTTYLLVGDLPPDHLEVVLAQLPEPGDGNLLARLWRGLFG